MDDRVYLKVKIKSLAEEAKIIRNMEKRFKVGSPHRHGLRYHRILDVRREQRATLLAYGFLRGVPYRAIESKNREPFPIQRVSAMVTKYGVAAFEFDKTGTKVYYGGPGYQDRQRQIVKELYEWLRV